MTSTSTSTSITKVGGVVIVTQVIPQDDGGIPLQSSPPTAPQSPPTARPPTARPPTACPPKVDDMTATFLRAGPQALGVVQISIGVLCILFSLTAVYSPLLLLHAPLCLAVSFVVSGSVAMAAGKRTSVGLVWASLVWNLISSLLGLLGIAFVSWLLAGRRASERFCDPGTFMGFVPSDEQLRRCIDRADMLDVGVYGCLGLVLVLLVLQVCVTITVCVFSTRALQRRDRFVPYMEKEAESCSALLPGAISGLGSDVSLLDCEGDETSTSPPNSP